MTTASIDQALQQAEGVCVRKGGRMTKARRLVMAALLETEQPLGAYDIKEHLSRSRNSLPVMTIYRTLAFLTRVGLAHQVGCLNAWLSCAHPEHGHNCQLLVCEQCQGVTEACDSDLEQAIQQSADAQEFTLSGSTVEITGVCGCCGKKSGPHDGIC